jgi:dTDP-glucose 4,6-dehydratase
VTDVARAISTVLAQGVVGETYNIGSDNKMLIAELAAQVVAMANDEYDIGLKQSYVASNTDRPFNDERYRLDWSKITRLGWAPQVEFANGLREIFKWHAADASLRHNHWNDCEWLPLVNQP